VELESLKERKLQEGGKSFFQFQDLINAKALFILNTDELVFSKFTAIKLREL
jgi:hypothetical protein